jgi:hypothetical protein
VDEARRVESDPQASREFRDAALIGGFIEPLAQLVIGVGE